MKLIDEYDYIIIGAGAAGLSLAYHLLNDDFTKNASILIMDKEKKTQLHDKTWCFWEKDINTFEHIVKFSWQNLIFKSPHFQNNMTISPYHYKMIQSEDFYNSCWQVINKANNAEIAYFQVDTIKENNVVCGEKIFTGKVIFNSAIFSFEPAYNQYYLLQHFKGWYIRFENEILNPHQATLMDFDIEQFGDCRFVYLLPTSKQETLVEYTVFSPNTLQYDEYDSALNLYLNQKFPNQKYTIISSEFGVIPMTNNRINRVNEKNIFHIGIAGNATKASTGYTFLFIQRQCKKILEGLKNSNLTQEMLSPKARFKYYDSVLLQILSGGLLSGRAIFSKMFKELPSPLVLKFLNEETTLLEEIKVMWYSQKSVFVTAAVKQIWYQLKSKI
jgi:lycopene beta-cyclase